MTQVNIPLSDERLACIDRVAAESEILNDSPVITLAPDVWDALVDVLDAPSEADLVVRACFARQPQWDR